MSVTGLEPDRCAPEFMNPAANTYSVAVDKLLHLFVTQASDQ